MDPKINMREVMLEKLRFGIQTRISEEIIDHGELKFLEDQVTRTLVIRFRSFLWSEDLGQSVIKFPANWIEAFKERWFPAWLRRRFPVEYSVRIVKAKALYPDFSPSVDGERFLFHTTIEKGRNLFRVPVTIEEDHNA